MAQQLPLYQIPMPQQPSQQAIAQGYNQPPLQPLYQQAQQPQVVADVSPQSMAVAGANRQGVDWAGLLGNLGSYMAAAGSAYGLGANPSQGLLNAANATQKHTQNINQYNTMAPKYQQMGYDVSGYDPRRGGAGISTTPMEMIDLQSKIAERDYLNEYRQTMAEARLAQQQQKQQSMQTVGDLMLFNPEFRKMMNTQYDFRNGANAGILKRPVSKEALQNMMPKNVNMNYTGGLNSSKTSNATIRHTGTSGGSKGKGKPNDHSW